MLLGLHVILLFLGNPPLIDNHTLSGVIESGAITLWNHPYHEPEALLLAPFFVLFMAASYALFFAAIRGAWKIMIGAVILALLSAAFFYFGINDDHSQGIAEEIAHLLHPSVYRTVATMFLPILVC